MTLCDFNDMKRCKREWSVAQLLRSNRACCFWQSIMLFANKIQQYVLTNVVMFAGFQKKPQLKAYGHPCRLISRLLKTMSDDCRVDRQITITGTSHYVVYVNIIIKMHTRVCNLAMTVFTLFARPISSQYRLYVCRLWRWCRTLATHRVELFGNIMQQLGLGQFVLKF